MWSSKYCTLVGACYNVIYGNNYAGAGGGYNERENVEYKEREESDDEYDEVFV